MPSDRFLNLPEEKRERICAAVMYELSKHPVEELSINRIIKEAGIPRGSFYQYFEDKKDLLIYIMSDVRRNLEEKFKSLMKESGGNPLEAVSALFHYAVDMIIEFGSGEICRNLFANMPMGFPDPFEMIRNDLMGDAVSTVRYVYGFNDFNLTEQDIMDIFDMVVDTMRMSMARMFADMSRRGEIERSFKQ